MDKTSLEKFRTRDSLYEAGKDLFESDLQIPLKFITSLPVDLHRIFGDSYRPKIHDTISNAYFIGMVDDEAFEGSTGIPACGNAESSTGESSTGIPACEKESNTAESNTGFQPVNPENNQPNQSEKNDDTANTAMDGCATFDANTGTDACASAPASVHCQRGASPLRAYTLRPVADCNCVAVRRGGKQQKAKVWSVVKRTRFGWAL